MTLASPLIPRWQILAAFAVIYFVWGSTYIAQRFALESIPPLWMGGACNLVSGLMLFAWARLRGAPMPTRANLRATVLVCAFIFVIYNSVTVWAAQHLPSSMLALLLAVVPMWMVLIDWARPGGTRPHIRTLVGVGLGLVGIFLLVSPGQEGLNAPHMIEAIVGVLVGAAFFVIGTLYAKGAAMPENPSMSAALQLICGGAMMLALGAWFGEGARFQVDALLPRSIIGWLYMTIFGSLIAYSCFVWLMRVENPARVATYAYVNPVIAVFVGWLVGGEALTPQTLVSAAVIVGAVVLITNARARSAGASDVQASAVAVVEGAEA